VPRVIDEQTAGREGEIDGGNQVFPELVSQEERRLSGNESLQSGWSYPELEPDRDEGQAARVEPAIAVPHRIRTGEHSVLRCPGPPTGIEHAIQGP